MPIKPLEQTSLAICEDCKSLRSLGSKQECTLHTIWRFLANYNKANKTNIFLAQYETKT